MSAETRPGFSEDVLTYEPQIPEPREHIIGSATTYLALQSAGLEPPLPPPEILDEIRFIRPVFYKTFRSSEGRQWAQIEQIDAILRMLREDGYKPNWQELDDPYVRHLMRQQNIPADHVPLAEEQAQDVFEFWWHMTTVWLGPYVFGEPLPAGEGDTSAEHLPRRQELVWFMRQYLQHLPYYSTSGNREEIGGMNDTLAMYRQEDPDAKLSADEAIRRFALPGMIQADGHWILNPYNEVTNPSGRARPGSPFDSQHSGVHDDHHSAIHTLIPRARARRDKGKSLDPTELFYARVGDLLDDIGQTEGGYETYLPTYLELINGYNQLHPDNPVKVLHRASEPSDASP